MPTKFDEAFARVEKLVATFDANKERYLSADYQEAEVRKDFIDKFSIALGWDVNHDEQTNPYAQEVKVERNVNEGSSRKKADYAFYLTPNFRDVRFYIEAKRPSNDFASSDNYLQGIRYGWFTKRTSPFAVLTSFDDFHILDCRLKPDINDTLSRVVERFTYTDYADREKFARIYWLFSREAVASGSLEKYAEAHPTPKGKKFQRGLFKGGDTNPDEDFLEELDGYRQKLAQAFKKKNLDLDGDLLTEVTQRTLDRLVFTRFLEDKGIETPQVENFGKSEGVWEDFINASLRLDRKYNGVVYKWHPKLDAPGFAPDVQVFSRICEDLTDPTSPYNFNTIPIHILGSIYERFLGKVISDSARVVEKPEVRKAGGVYYTPEYIVRYIVENTVGKMIEGKTPAQIAEMKFADIACGSGSFLLGVYDVLLQYHSKYYANNPGKMKKGDCVRRDGSLHLSLQKKRDILVNNLFGVDIDRQAVEVAQLSLYLKLLEDETVGSTSEFQTEFHFTLLPSLDKNIVCGNSLIGPDILDGGKLSVDEEKKLNPMDYAQRFPQIFRRKVSGGELRDTPAAPLDYTVPGVPLHGSFSYKKTKKTKAAPETEYEGGFDAIVGNPPYVRPHNLESNVKEYFWQHYKTFTHKSDLYCSFMENATRL
ncbi:MAG: N-6 DNA methylase, partial [Verrucomicrobiota bacterium]